MIVAEELDHDINLIRVIENDTDMTPNSGATVGSQSIQSTRQGLPRRGGVLPPDAARHGGDASSASPPARSRSRRASSPAAARRRARASCSAASCFNATIAGLATTSPAARSRLRAPGLTAGTYATHGAGLAAGLRRALVKRCRQLHARRQGRARSGRHPVEGHRHLHVRAQRPDPGHAPRPARPPARAGRRVRRRRTRRCCRSTRARSRTSRTRRSCRTATSSAWSRRHEYDAIQAAAQLKVTVGADAEARRAAGTCGRRCAPSTRRARLPARYVVNVGQRRHGDRRRGARRCRATLHVPVQRPPADRPVLRVAGVKGNGARIYSNAQNIYSLRSSVANVLGFTANQVRVSYFEGSSVYGDSP